MTQKFQRFRSIAIITATLTLLTWGAAWAALDRDLHTWSYSCDTDMACQTEDEIREKAEGSIR
jgi:hypothetical protein